MTFSRIFASKAHPNSVGNTKATHAAATIPGDRRTLILGSSINQALAYDTTGHPVVLNHLEISTDEQGAYVLLANLGDDTTDCAPVMLHPGAIDQFIVSLVKESTASKTTCPSVDFDFEQSNPPEVYVPPAGQEPGIDRFGYGDFLGEAMHHPPPKIVALPLILPIPDIELPVPLTIEALAAETNPSVRVFAQAHPWLRDHHANTSLHTTDRLMLYSEIQNSFPDSVKPHLNTHHTFSYTLLPPGSVHRKAVINNVQATLRANGLPSPTSNVPPAMNPSYLAEHNKVNANLASAIAQMAAAATKSASTKSERDKTKELEQAGMSFRGLGAYPLDATDAHGVTTTATIFPEVDMDMLELFERGTKPMNTHHLHSQYAQALAAKEKEPNAHFLLQHTNHNTLQFGTYFNALVSKCRFNDEPIDASNLHTLDAGLTINNFVRAKSSSTLLIRDIVDGVSVERQELAENDVTKVQKQKSAYRTGCISDPRDLIAATANFYALLLLVTKLPAGVTPYAVRDLLRLASRFSLNARGRAWFETHTEEMPWLGHCLMMWKTNMLAPHIRMAKSSGIVSAIRDKTAVAPSSYAKIEANNDFYINLCDRAITANTTNDLPQHAPATWSSCHDTPNVNMKRNGSNGNNDNARNNRNQNSPNGPNGNRDHNGPNDYNKRRPNDPPHNENNNRKHAAVLGDPTKGLVKWTGPNQQEPVPSFQIQGKRLCRNFLYVGKACKHSAADCRWYHAIKSKLSGHERTQLEGWANNTRFVQLCAPLADAPAGGT